MEIAYDRNHVHELRFKSFLDIDLLQQKVQLCAGLFEKIETSVGYIKLILTNHHLHFTGTRQLSRLELVCSLDKNRKLR